MDYKVVDAEKLDADLTTVAEAIKDKTGSSEKIAFPEGFVQMINSIKLSQEERPTATYEYDLSNDGASHVTGNILYISTFEMPIAEGTEIKDIEFLDSEGNYVSIKNLDDVDNVEYAYFFKKSFLDDMGCLCFGKIAVLNDTKNWVADNIETYAEVNTRITYYTD